MEQPEPASPPQGVQPGRGRGRGGRRGIGSQQPQVMFRGIRGTGAARVILHGLGRGRVSRTTRSATDEAGPSHQRTTLVDDPSSENEVTSSSNTESEREEEETAIEGSERENNEEEEEAESEHHEEVEEEEAEDEKSKYMRNVGERNYVTSSVEQ